MVYCATPTITAPAPQSSIEPGTMLQTELPKRFPGWGDVTDKLLDILQLPDDWDGQGAISPAVSGAGQRCFEFVQELRRTGESDPPIKIRPTPDGCVAFVWDIDGLVIEAEVGADSVEWFDDDL